MRLSDGEREAIVSATLAFFGRGAVVRLFGSRLNDRLRGGDIDLLVELDGPLPDYLRQSQFQDRIERATDDKKIDLLFVQRAAPHSAFERIALRDGVAL